MKKLALATLCVLATLGAQGQGTFVIGNIGGAAPAGAAAGGAVNIMAGPQGGALESVATGAMISANLFFGINGSVPTVAGGSSADFQVEVTTADGGSALSNVFSGGPLGGAGTPPAPPAAVGGAAITAFTAAGPGPGEGPGPGPGPEPVIPEPSTYALLALGGAAMLFRRRK